MLKFILPALIAATCLASDMAGQKRPPKGNYTLEDFFGPNHAAAAKVFGAHVASDGSEITEYPNHFFKVRRLSKGTYEVEYATYLDNTAVCSVTIFTKVLNVYYYIPKITQADDDGFTYVISNGPTMYDSDVMFTCIA
eukprot:m.17627 g.17627  ORF g.17627 m.17627 type:complete len:138 (+) comp27523_c0_seq1:124-537(+)